MEFQDKHKEFFNTSVGAFSEVTDREFFDSQVTVTKEEKKIILDYFGQENVLKGNKTADPEKAAKKFLLYPDLEPIQLNLVFPKPEKTELRLYLSKEHGFKPKGGDLWFVFINEDGKLVIGSSEEEEWFSIGRKVQRHSFQPGAMSIIQMGEELIGHPSTAINELVKNSYDADSHNSKVYFHLEKDESESFAIISDNGVGMNKDILFGNWLKPSVSGKRISNPVSAIYKRNLLGSKGIGRLASMALGENITVISKMETDSEYNWISIKRNEFRVDTLLSAIDFPGDQIENFVDILSHPFFLKERKCKKNEQLLNILKLNNLDSFSNGTLIIVEHLDSSVVKMLKEDFDQTELLKVEKEPYRETTFYKSLSALVTPLNINSEIQKELQLKEIIEEENKVSIPESSFVIYFGTNLLPQQDQNKIDWQEIESVPIQSICDYRVYGKVETNGNVKGFFRYNRLVLESYEEPFEITFEQINDQTLKGETLNLFDNNHNNETGEYYFDIRVYDIGEKENVEKLAKEAKFDSVAKFRTAFKNIQGLKISKNGFGVKPYGDEVEDWIGLSKARVQNPGQNVNTNQILGYVFFFSPENDSIQEKTNREGFIENTAFLQVKNTLSAIFKVLGRKRYNYRLLHGIGRIPDSKHNRPDFDAFIEKMKEAGYIDKNFINYSENFMKEVNTSMDNLEESLSFSERLASLGSGIELVYHEMAQPISGLKTTKSSLNLKKNKIDSSVLEYFISDINTLGHATETLTNLRESLQPAIGRTRIKKFSPYNTFTKVVNLFKSDQDEFKISIVADERLKSFEINDLEYAFWIAFLNIINNAIYWIKKSEKPGEIRFYMEQENIIVSNSGPFIREDFLEHIFKYGVTTRHEKNATGLGLAFTQGILSRNDWQITAENREDGPAFIIKKNN